MEEKNEPHTQLGGEGKDEVKMEGEVVLIKPRGDGGMYFVLCGGSAQASALSENPFSLGTSLVRARADEQEVPRLDTCFYFLLRPFASTSTSKH